MATYYKADMAIYIDLESPEQMGKYGEVLERLKAAAKDLEASGLTVEVTSGAARKGPQERKISTAAATKLREELTA